jgi:hypothetical protein
MPLAGLGGSVPIHIDENGYPTGSGRPESTQLAALDGFVRAVNAYRGTYNVNRYSWFALRDNDSSTSDFQSHYGLLRSDYTAKPAFGRYCRLVERLAGPRQDNGWLDRWQHRRALRQCGAPGF